MDCKNCNIKLYNFNENGSNSSRYPIKMPNGEIWCQDCSDTYYVINPLPVPDEKESAEIAEALKHFKCIEPERPKSASPRNVKNEVLYTCVKCKVKTSGDKCTNCGRASPLLRKR